MSSDRVRLDPARIAHVLQSCSLVAGLHGGRRNRIATSVGDTRLVGVRVEGAGLVVGVIGLRGASTDDIARQVRAALSEHAPGYQVTVSVESTRDPSEGSWAALGAAGPDAAACHDPEDR